MKPLILSTSMLDLPLSCSSKVWYAKTTGGWENEISKFKDTAKNLSPIELCSLMAIFLGDGHPGHEYNHYFHDHGILDIFIHALESEVLDLGRASPSASSKAIDILRRSDLTNALVRWEAYFHQLNTEPQLQRCGLVVTYHLATILLQEDISALVSSCKPNN